MAIPNSPVATSDFMRDMGRGYEEFDFEAAWRAVRPRWDALPANVRALFVYARKVAGHLSQLPNLSMPWPSADEEAAHDCFDPLMGGLRARFDKVPGEFLEPAMELAWALGHWMPGDAPREDRDLFSGRPQDGCYWKFADYAMQSLVARGHAIRMPFPEETAEDRSRRKLREKYGESERGNYFVDDAIGVPHPYCITVRHIQHADTGILDAATIERAERGGAGCGVKGCKLPFSKHEKGLLVACKGPLKEGEKIAPELEAYLKKIQPLTEKDGFAGWAFRDAR